MNNTSLKFTSQFEQPLMDAVIENATHNKFALNRLLTAEIWINNERLSPKVWETTSINEGDIITVYPSINATGLAIAGTIGSAISAFASTTIGGIIVSSAVSIGVSFVVSSILNFIKGKKEQFTQGTAYSISGANNSYRPYEHLPVVIGETIIAPDYALQPYQDVDNNIQYINHLFVVSAGDVEVLNVRNGTTQVASVINGDYEYYVYRNWQGEPFKWHNKTIETSSANFKLFDTKQNIYTFETPQDTDKINLMLTFPSGMYALKGSEFVKLTGNIAYVIVTNLDTGEVVINVDGVTNANGYGIPYAEDTSKAGYKYLLELKYYNRDIQDFNKNIPIPKGRYKVEISEVYVMRDGDRPYPMVNWTRGSYQYYADVYVTEVQSQIDAIPIKYTGQSLTLLELRAKASDRLSGALDTINCLARLQGIDSNGNYTTTGNIAHLARRLLTDNNLVITAGQVPLDDDSFLAFEQHCDRYGFTASTYETSGRTLGEVLADMLEIAQGYVSLSNGQYVITYDNPDGDIVDVITARNSSNMTITQSKPIQAVNGLRVMYYNKDKDYAQDEITVPDITASNIEKVDAPLISNYQLAYKYGMLALARYKLRNKVISFSTDWRAIDYKLGEKLLIQHANFFLGIGAEGKVVGYLYNDNDYVEAVVLDQYYDTELGKQYSLQDGTKYSQKFWDISAIANEETNILYFTVPIMPSQAPELNKFLVFGETDKIGLEVLIKSITRNVDYTADIECIPSATGYYDAISGEIPPYESALTFPSEYDRSKPIKPQMTNYIADETTASFNNRGEIVLNAVLSMTYTEKAGVFFDRYEVVYSEVNNEYSEKIQSYDKNIINISNLKQDTYYRLSIQAVSTAGTASDILVEQIHVIGLLTPPNPIDELYINGNLLEIKHNDKPIDFAGYEVKLSLNTIDSYEQAILVTNPLNLDGIVNISPYITSAKRIFCKVVDTMGLKSEAVAININIGEDVTRNLYEVISEAGTGWNGVITNGYIENNKLVSELSKQVLWNGTDKRVLWNGIDKQVLYSNVAMRVTYAYDIEITELLHYSYLYVEAVLESGNIKEIMVSKHSLVDGEDYYSTPVLLSNYQISPSDEKLRIIVNFDNLDNLICTDILTKFDVEDKPLMVFQDIEVTGDNFLVQVPQNYFKRIKNVNISLQYDSSRAEFNSAYSAKVISKGTIVDGYVSDGVTIACYDINGNIVDGLVDIMLQGY